MKKTISVLLAIMMLLSCLSTITVAGVAYAAAPATLNNDPSFGLVQENENLALYINKNTGDFAIRNQKTGMLWYSTPTDAEQDKFAQGESKEALTTKLNVVYLTSSYNTPTVNSNSASVITERNGNDWILTFYFKGASTNFAIPVLLRLEKDYVHVELLIDRIKELGDTRVLKVELFPFFGAAGLKDKGYALLPDGSGSLMEFNRKHLNSYVFGASGEGMFYGTNPTEVAIQNYFTNWNESVRLPVLGMVKNNDAYLSIIESGAAVASYYGYVSRYINSYNTAYVGINVRDTQQRISSTGRNGKGFYYTDELPENYIARYYLLDGEDADYVGMAKKYREYLIENMGMSKVKETASNTLCINLYGSVKKAKHFLGIPYTGSEELTTYSEASELVDRLVESGVDKAYINYSGWGKGGLETTMSTKFSANSTLGGKSDMKELIEKVNGIANYNLSFDVDMQAFYGGNSDVKKFKNTAYGLDSSPVTIFKARVSAAGALDKTSIAHQLVHPGYMLDYANKFMKNATAQNVSSFSFNTIGDTLYCAYNLLDECTRDESAAAMSAIFQAASKNAGEKGIVSTSGGNAYAMPYVDLLVKAPVNASHNNISLQEVPFYQIVFRGYVNMAGDAFNLDSEQDDLLLKLAETGMSLYYDLMDAESTAFQDTTFTNCYACELDDHYDTMVTNYKKLSNVYNIVQDSTIENYEIIGDDIRVTTFDNGAKVYVNYADSDVNVDGIMISAKDFTVVGGANA